MSPHPFLLSATVLGLLVGNTTAGGDSVARASDIIGQDIQNAAGEKIADIQDLVVRPSGDIVAVVDRESGGVIGIPLSSLTPVCGEDAKEESGDPKRELDHFVYAGDASKLSMAPTVTDRTLVDRIWIDRCCEHFLDKSDTSGNTATPADDPICFEKFVGTDVKDSAGEELAEVKDVVVDLNQDEVAYVVISSGGVLGMGDKLHGVPLDSLSFNAEKDYVTLDTDRATLERTPGLDVDRLPTRPNLQVSEAATIRRDTDRPGP